MILLQRWSAPMLMRWLSDCLDLHQGSLVLLLAQEVSCLNVHLEYDLSVEHVGPLPLLKLQLEGGRGMTAHLTLGQVLVSVVEDAGLGIEKELVIYLSMHEDFRVRPKLKGDPDYC